MIKYMYSYYNALAGHYQTPYISDFSLMDTEAIKGFLGESLFYANSEVLNSLKENDLYLVGKFDTSTGCIEVCNEFIIHLSELINRVIAAKGDENVGK